MNRIVRILRKLDRDNLPHYTRCAVQLLWEKFTTLLTRISSQWWGVTLGPHCAFVGCARFIRSRGSSIAIGKNGRFLSAEASNRHGLNRACMLSTLKPGAVLIIGDNVGMSGTVVCCATRVEIGNRVMLGANTTVTDTDSHPLDYRKRFPAVYGEAPESVATEVLSAPIIIGDDVFIGMHTLILKGVSIGPGTVVGAGSVVSRSLPAHCIAAGNPAKPLKYFETCETTESGAEVISHRLSHVALCQTPPGRQRINIFER